MVRINFIQPDIERMGRMIFKWQKEEIRAYLMIKKYKKLLNKKLRGE